MANRQITDFPPVSSVSPDNVFHIHTGVNNHISAEDLFIAIADEIIIPATVSDVGVVQLEDSVSSTSITKAATSNSVKQAYDLAASKVDETVEVLAGNGLTGGGDLTSNVTVSLGTPGTLDGSTTNNVTPTGHTHQVDFPVTSVAGKTGDVTISTVDVDGLASVSISGDYTDLLNTPTLGTVSSRDVVTGSGDTTVTRIPTVDWVQSNAGGGSSNWTNIYNNVLLDVNKKYLVTPGPAIVEVTLPSGIDVGKFIVIKCSHLSGENVRIINDDYTISGPLGSASPGDDIVMIAGDVVQLVCTGSNFLEVV